MRNLDLTIDKYIYTHIYAIISFGRMIALGNRAC